MTRAWTGTALVGLCVMWAFACEVSVNDGPLDPIDETGGTGGTAAGTGGSSGSAGSAGSAGQGGTAGESNAGAAGTAGTAGTAGSAGSGEVYTTTCEPEADDDQDPCLVCIKQQCCTEWEACTDEGCQTERLDVVDCASDPDVFDSETYGDCLSMSSFAGDGLLQVNSNALMECVNEVVPAEGDAGLDTTRCQEACFGHEIFLE